MSETIQVTFNPNADTRTCDFRNVTEDELLKASVGHIADVARGLEFFAAYLRAAGIVHDQDKVTAIGWFHECFATGFKDTSWWDNHRKIWRHHLTAADGIPADVNLLDVLEFIADCVLALKARTGSVPPLSLPDELLRRAFDNTVALLDAHVEVKP